MRRTLLVAPVAVLLLLLTTCSYPCAGGDGACAPQPTATGATAAASCDDAQQQRYPDVVDARLEPRGDEFTVSVTLSSPYDTPERYADGWRVLTPDGDVLAEHTLAHDHANEQPFTRTSAPFEIPADVREVVIEGRDLVHGYGGDTMTIEVPR